MIPFNGFEEILMHVIKETVHDYDMDRDGKPIKSKEERFDDAMSAIFGKQYERRFIQTSDFFASELIAIKELQKQGCQLRGTVAEIAKYRLPEIRNDKQGNQKEDDKREYEAELTRLEGQVKKHFKRQEKHYKEIDDIESEHAFFSEKELLAEDIAQRENIFKALRAAGWSIY